ncbi:MAG: FAD:protein FMN transferase [Lentisphaeria bacterium]
MKKLSQNQWIAIIGLAMLLAVSGYMYKYKTKQTSVEFAVFNTYCSIQYIFYPTADPDTLSRDIIAELQQLHNRINIYDPKSELSQLNKTAVEKPFHCSPELWSILKASREAWRVTDGVFDISVGPLMHLWGFHGKRNTIPTETEIAEALTKVGLDKVQYDEKNHTIYFTTPEMRLDLGGIAKGYALDLAVKQLKKVRKNYAGVIFDFGGNIYASGKENTGRKFSIGVRDPVDAQIVRKQFILENQFIATSANYERALQIGEKKIGHIVSPITGRPVKTYASVTAKASSGWCSDVFSTAVFAGGEKIIKKIHESYPETEFFLQ